MGNVPHILDFCFFFTFEWSYIHYCCLTEKFLAPNLAPSTLVLRIEKHRMSGLEAV